MPNHLIRSSFSLVFTCLQNVSTANMQIARPFIDRERVVHFCQWRDDAENSGRSQARQAHREDAMADWRLEVTKFLTAPRQEDRKAPMKVSHTHSCARKHTFKPDIRNSQVRGSVLQWVFALEVAVRNGGTPGTWHDFRSNPAEHARPLVLRSSGPQIRRRRIEDRASGYE